LLFELLAMESFVDRMERQYTQDVNVDDIDELDDDEDADASVMNTDLPPSRPPVRQARQSTIVQVNTGALEVIIFTITM
jgi:hypothetical protein